MFRKVSPLSWGFSLKYDIFSAKSPPGVSWEPHYSFAYVELTCVIVSLLNISGAFNQNNIIKSITFSGSQLNMCCV